MTAATCKQCGTQHEVQSDWGFWECPDCGKYQRTGETPRPWRRSNAVGAQPR